MFLRVLVIGGLGFIGSHVVEKFVDKGYDVSVLSRSTRGLWRLRELYEEGGFDLFLGDIMDNRNLRRIMKGFDAVINMVALISHPIKGMTYRVNFHGSLNVLRTAYELGVKRVIQTSVAQVYFPKTNGVIRDLSLWAPFSEYLAGKIGGEIVANRYREKGLDVLVYRPSVVVGPRSPHGLNLLILTAYNGLSVLSFGRSETLLNPIYVEDLAEAYVKGVEYGSGTYYLAGGYKTTLHNILKYASLKGRRIPPLVYIENPELTAATLEVIQRALSFINLILPLPTDRSVIDTLFQDNVYSPLRAINELDWRPKHSVTSGIDKTIEWFDAKKLYKVTNTVKFILYGQPP